MKLTYDELEAQITQSNANLLKCQELLKLALERIVKLEERLNKNSNNSSKPPSTDQKGNSPDRPKKERKGRQGKNRIMLPKAEIDHFHNCTLATCLCCGSQDLIDQNQPLILQQVEIPQVKATATQFECSKYNCISCGETSFASLPQGVPDF